MATKTEKRFGELTSLGVTYTIILLIDNTTKRATRVNVKPLTSGTIRIYGIAKS